MHLNELSLTVVSVDMDECLIRIFELQDELLKRRETLNTLIGSGYLNMAKARYSLGSKRIGMLQVNLGDNEAQTKVTSIETSSSVSGMTFKTYDLLENHRDNYEKTTIRQRTAVSPEEDGELKSSYSSKTVDPINWFGILVPAELRNSQKEFKQALEAVLDLATLQNELIVLQSKYYELKKRKYFLKDDVKENSESLLNPSQEKA